MAAFEWNILRFSVCEACGLGPDDGLLHACRGRWASIRRARLPAMDLDRLPPRRRLDRLSERALRGLGRLTVPLLRRGDGELLELSWDDATKLAAHRLGEGARIVGDRPRSIELEWTLERLAACVADGPGRLILGRFTDGGEGFRAHLLEHLTPAAVAPGGEVLLLPTQSRYSQAGGASWRGPDGVVRFSPEIRGNPVPDARPDWAILGGVLGLLDPSEAIPLDVAAVRSRIAQSDPDLRGLGDLRSPGDRLPPRRPR